MIPTTCSGTARHDQVSPRHAQVPPRHGQVPHDMVRYHTTWSGTTRHGQVPHDIVQIITWDFQESGSHMLGIVVFALQIACSNPGVDIFLQIFFRFFSKGSRQVKTSKVPGRHMISVSGWISGQIGPSWPPWSLTWPPCPLVVTQGVDSQDMSCEHVVCTY